MTIDTYFNVVMLGRGCTIDAVHGSDPEHAPNSIAVGVGKRIMRPGHIVVDVSWRTVRCEHPSIDGSSWLATTVEGITVDDGDIIGRGRTEHEAILNGHINLLAEISKQVAKLLTQEVLQDGVH